MRRAAINGILYQDFPAICALLEGVEVKGYEVVEKVALYLATEDVDLAAENIEGVAIPAWRSRSSW